jgi:hypothetical protein
MPQSDLVTVNVALRPANAARPAFGTSLLLHNLTDAQDALMGSSRTSLLTAATWPADLAALSITDGEAAYESVQSHFSQPRKPTKAYLGRRGKNIQQVWTVVVPTVPADGVYAISVTGATGTPYSFTASTSTQAAVRTALLAALAAGSATFTAASGVGAGDIKLTAVTSGVPLVVQVSSPAASMTASVTTGTSVLTVAQVWDMHIVTAALGVYTLTVQTTTGQKTYTHIATTGATVTTIRNAIKALYDADSSDLFTATMASVSTDHGTLTASLAGRSGSVTITSPASDATATVTTANYGVADDWAVMATSNTDWYHGVLGSKVAAELLLSEEWFRGDDRHMLGLQSSDADILTTVTTDVFSKLKARASYRVYGVQHHIDAEGIVEAWAGDVLTDPAGSVSWPWKQLTGFTDRVLEADEAAALRSKEGSFLEDFAARDQSIMNGGYSFAGRPIDIARALDTLRSNMEVAVADLFIGSRIVPYSKQGQSAIEGVLWKEIAGGVEAGYAIDGSFTIEFDDITPGTNDAVRGIYPDFDVTGVIQAGGYKVIVNMELSQ